jgi:hypothetical protein
MPKVDLLDPMMPMIMSLDKLIKAGRWLSAQDNLNAEHVKCSSNKTIMALILKIVIDLHKRQALPPTVRVTDVIAYVALRSESTACFRRRSPQVRKTVVDIGWAERALLGAGLATRLNFRMVSARDGGWAKLNYLATVGWFNCFNCCDDDSITTQTQQVGSFTHVSDSTLRLMPLSEREACSCWEGAALTVVGAFIDSLEPPAKSAACFRRRSPQVGKTVVDII